MVHIVFGSLFTFAGGNVHDHPVSVVRAIFGAAKTGNYSALSGLCDPSQKGDGDTKMICGMSEQNMEVKREFREQFRTGTIVGKAAITGDHASVKIKFGPKGQDSDEFRLIRIEGKWYLVSY
jgi:hypothetical protein